MEKLTHTPGPWIVEYKREFEEEELVSVRVENGYFQVARINANSPRVLENARLIAAAPELLAELIKMTEYAERLGARPCSAWAVIAKATGR